MLAHHWSAAMRYATATGVPPGRFRARAIAALTDAGERALALRAASAAARLFEQALELIAEEPPPQLLLRYGRSLYLAGDDQARQALERALEALRAADDRAGEAFGEAMLSHVAWLGGDTEEATRRINRAVELARPLPPSEVTAHVLARAAGRASVAHRAADAVALGREALALAERLGIEDLRVHVLTTLGLARNFLGDADGMRDLERAVELGLAVNSSEAGRAAYNLGVMAFLAGDIARFRGMDAEGRRIDERFGNLSMLRFSRGVAADFAYFAGDWDEAVRLADEFLAECETAPHYQEPHARAVRALVRFGRGDVEGALADLDRAWRGPSDPQSRGVPLAVGARIFWELGDPRAVPTTRELLSIDFGVTPEPLSSALLALIDVADEVRDRLREVVEAHDPARSRWVAAAAAVLNGQFLEAAEIYASMPFLPAEAEARTRAAETLIAEGRHDEAEAQLQRALSFWRSAGASRYIARAEQLWTRLIA